MTAPDGGLAVQILTLGERVAKLREDVDAFGPVAAEVVALAKDVQALTKAVVALQPEEDEPVGMWDWSKMNKDQATIAWEKLLAWVDDVLLALYGRVGDGLDGDVIPSCWYQHPEVVAELSWLCQEWHRIYQTRKGTPAAAGEWHDRWLPGVLARSRKLMQGCTRGTHKDRPRGQAIADQAALRATVAADIDARPAPPPPKPGPVVEQAAE